jgi:hypothetical protein
VRARSRAVCIQRRPSRLRAPRELLACSRLTLRLAAWRASIVRRHGQGAGADHKCAERPVQRSQGLNVCCLACTLKRALTERRDRVQRVSPAQSATSERPDGCCFACILFGSPHQEHFAKIDEVVEDLKENRGGGGGSDGVLRPLVCSASLACCSPFLSLGCSVCLLASRLMHGRVHTHTHTHSHTRTRRERTRRTRTRSSRAIFRGKILPKK